MSTRAELAAVEPSEEQKRTKIWQHPDSTTIQGLLVRKEPRWIERWLKDRYPTEDRNGVETENAVANAEMQLTERTLTRYRDKYLPEAADGITGSVVNSEIEDLIGHRLPAPIGTPWELQVMETALHVAQANLARALKADDDMEMLQPITLDAQSRLVATIGQSVDMKSRLGLPGYEAAPEQQHIFTQNEHVSVELQGRLDPKTGQVTSVDPERLDLARALLQASPQERQEIIEASRTAMLNAAAVDATAIEEPVDGGS